MMARINRNASDPDLCALQAVRLFVFCCSRLSILVMMHRIRILVPTCSTFATTQELSEFGYKSACWLQEAIHLYEESDTSSFALDDLTLDWSVVDWDRVPSRRAVANEEPTRLFPVLLVPRHVRENIEPHILEASGMADEEKEGEDA